MSSIIYFPKKCIGNGSCAVKDPLHFAVKEKKAQLLGGRKNAEEFLLEGNFSEEQLKKILEAAKHCPVNAIRVTGAGKEIVSNSLRELPEANTIHAQYDDLKEFVMDPKGYFLIRTAPERKEIEVALCAERNLISKKVVGKTPLEIYQTCIKEGMLSRHDHAAYLGRELQKAFVALQLDIPYVQDDELNLNK